MTRSLTLLLTLWGVPGWTQTQYSSFSGSASIAVGKCLTSGAVSVVDNPLLVDRPNWSITVTEDWPCLYETQGIGFVRGWTLVPDVSVANLGENFPGYEGRLLVDLGMLGRLLITPSDPEARFRYISLGHCWYHANALVRVRRFHQPLHSSVEILIEWDRAVPPAQP